MKNIKIRFIPKTYLGKWSIRLIITFILFLALFFLFVALGERGGDTFFSNLRLTIPMFIAGISGIASFFTGFISIIKRKERSIFVFLATVIGFLILIYILLEILFPH